MIPGRLLLVLLPLLALLGLPTMRQVEVCHDRCEEAPTAELGGLHWAGACLCQGETAAAADEPACAPGPRCDCQDQPLAPDDASAMAGQSPNVATPRAAPLLIALTYPSQPRSSAKVPRHARPPPARAVGLTHLASVRLLI